MKRLMGTSCEGNSEMQGLANKHTEGDMCSMVNSINELFVSVSEVLPILQASHSIFDVSDPLPVQYIISVDVTEAALVNINKQSHWAGYNSSVDCERCCTSAVWTGHVNIQ